MPLVDSRNLGIPIKNKLH